MADDSRKDYKPPYQKWSELDFIADESVQLLTWLQKFLYRTLLQKMFFCKTRPYLPDDDEQLWHLAGAKNQKMWNENREAIIPVFFTQLERDGVKLLRNKRVDEEWQDLIETLEKNSKAGKASAAKRRTQSKSTDGDRTLNERSTDIVRASPGVEPTTETATVSERVRVKAVDSETANGYAAPAGSVPTAPSANAVSLTVLNHKQRQNQPPHDWNEDEIDIATYNEEQQHEPLCMLWTRYMGKQGTPYDVRKLFVQYEEGQPDPLQVLWWVINDNADKSGEFKYWLETLQSAKHFSKVYETILKQYINWTAAKVRNCEGKITVADAYRLYYRKALAAAQGLVKGSNEEDQASSASSVEDGEDANGLDESGSEVDIEIGVPINVEDD